MGNPRKDLFAQQQCLHRGLFCLPQSLKQLRSHMTAIANRLAALPQLWPRRPTAAAAAPT